jgi:NADPH:quinone reductase-like Zn-dependent oxidoreductase
MRAAIVETYGPPETIKITERPAPTPGPTELLVRIHASPVTQGDRRIRAGDFPGFMAVPGRLMMGVLGPRASVPGSMFAGVVLAVGADVTGFAVGDRVFGASMDSAHADLLVIDQAKAVAHVPDGVSLAEAAAVCFGAGTALPFLRDLGELQPGDELLVIGAAGGVGRYAVQVGRHLGARVTGVCSAGDVEFVRSLGADRVIDRSQVDWPDEERSYAVILDTSGTVSFGQARRRLTDDGRFLNLELSLTLIWDMLLTGFGAGQKARSTVVMDDQANVEAVAALLATGAIRAAIGARFPLEQLVDAHTALEAGDVQGDVIVEAAAPPPQPMPTRDDGAAGQARGR